MLRVKVYINEKELEDIQIVNSGEKMENGDTIYTARNGDFTYKIFHKRSDGWEVLLQKFLEMQIGVNKEIRNLPLNSIIKNIKI